MVLSQARQTELLIFYAEGAEEVPAWVRSLGGHPVQKPGQGGALEVNS